MLELDNGEESLVDLEGDAVLDIRSEIAAISQRAFRDWCAAQSRQSKPNYLLGIEGASHGVEREIVTLRSEARD